MRVLPKRALARSAAVAAAACVVALPASAATSAAPAASPATVCSTSSWGLGARSHASTRSRPLVDVRAGQQPCYDRLVLEFRGPVNGYRVQYVTHVAQEGSGKPVPLAGRAALQVTVIAPADDDSGATYEPADPAHVVNVAGFQAFRQVGWAGSFEGQTTLGIGMRRGLPFRVLVLAGPGRHTRIVIDVAHNR